MNQITSIDDRLTIKLAIGIVEVIQLTEPGICADIGIEVERFASRHVYVSGTQHALEVLADRCDSYGDAFGWDVPSWYHRSAGVAAKTIRRAVSDHFPPPDENGDDDA